MLAVIDILGYHRPKAAVLNATAIIFWLVDDMRSLTRQPDFLIRTPVRHTATHPARCLCFHSSMATGRRFDLPYSVDSGMTRIGTLRN